MWTSVLNFHTLQAPGNSIRQAENPVTSGILPTATGPFIHPPSVNLERGRKRMDAGLFQADPGNKLRKFLQHTHICISTISEALAARGRLNQQQNCCNFLLRWTLGKEMCRRQKTEQESVFIHFPETYFTTGSVTWPPFVLLLLFSIIGRGRRLKGPFKCHFTGLL